MDSGLEGRCAIVTGASKGIGRAIALCLAEEGADLCLCARGVEALDALRLEICANGGAAVAVAADACNEADVAAVVTRATDEFGRLDILVNNVGGAPKFAAFDELTDDDWCDAFELNVISAVRFIRHALPWLKRSDAARIINIASLCGLEPGWLNPHYAAAKAAVINLSKHMSRVLAPEGVLVNAVCPGPTHSASWERCVSEAAASAGVDVETAGARMDREHAAAIPLGRMGEGDDVAGLVTFLASDRAAWITGSCMHVDGGKSRGML